jgi:AbrB family looped-hinge helix DNA binding protein
MNVGKMSKKGQIVIPKDIRERFGIMPGDAVIFKVKGDKIIIEKVDQKMSDILMDSKPVEDSLEFQKKLREDWE